MYCALVAFDSDFLSAPDEYEYLIVSDYDAKDIAKDRLPETTYIITKWGGGGNNPKYWQIDKVVARNAIEGGVITEKLTIEDDD